MVWIGAEPTGTERISIVGRTGDGRILLRLQRAPAESAWAVLAADKRHATLVVDWMPRYVVPVALLSEGAFVTLEDGRRIVRHAAGRAPEVLFPR